MLKYYEYLWIVGRETMWVADKWRDFELLDCSRGEKLERWGNYTLVRPDPQATMPFAASTWQTSAPAFAQATVAAPV